MAKYFLAQREGEIVEGKTPGLVYERAKFKDLKKLILDDYKLNKRKSCDRNIDIVTSCETLKH